MRAIQEARRCQPKNVKDPLVGAVAVDREGKLIDVAYRGEIEEGDHAEYTLLERKLPKHTLAGATIYTTLEPCTERNPPKIPCADRLYDRQVARVVVGMLDPNRKISGDGVRRLQAAKIAVEYFDEDLRLEVEEINRNFRRHFETLESHKARRSETEGSHAHAVMRAYLQRGEVRLSTMHRIAGAFLSGAGILILLPILLRDSLSTLVKVLVEFAVTEPWYVVLLCYVLPCLIVFGIPLWSLWLLLKDLTAFYFTANVPPGKQPPIPAGSRPRFNTAFHPRFALTGIPFADDESPETKKRIREYQFNTPLMFFLLPPNEDQQSWLREMEGSSDGKKVALPADEWLAECYDDEAAKALRMAFGLAGAYNRDLIEEVAKLELSLIRHNIHLRRLVLRYMKALLIIIWTATVAYVFSSLVLELRANLRLPAAVAALWLWSSLVHLIVRAPIRWIRSEYERSKSDRTRDPHLLFFEQVVVGVSICISMWAAGDLIHLVKQGWSVTFIAISIGLAGYSLYRTFLVNRPGRR